MYSQSSVSTSALTWVYVRRCTGTELWWWTASRRHHNFQVAIDKHVVGYRMTPMTRQVHPSYYRALHNSLQFRFRGAVFGCVCRGWNVTMSRSNYSTVNGQLQTDVPMLDPNLYLNPIKMYARPRGWSNLI